MWGRDTAGKSSLPEPCPRAGGRREAWDGETRYEDPDWERH